MNERIPKQARFVRRRRYEGTSLLISRDQQFELDQFTDRFWCACDGRKSVSEIARELAEVLRMDPSKAARAAQSTAQFLASLDLLSLCEPGDETRPES